VLQGVLERDGAERNDRTQQQSIPTSLCSSGFCVVLNAWQIQVLLSGPF
jgi:hypothetical protein